MNRFIKRWTYPRGKSGMRGMRVKHRAAGSLQTSENGQPAPGIFQALDSCLLRVSRGWSLLLAAMAFVMVGVSSSVAQQTVYWRNGAGVANWWDGANPWYRSCDGWWIARPDYNTCSDNTIVGPNEVHFDNGSDLTMNINGAMFQVTRLLFDSGTGARTMTTASGGGIDMLSSSGTVKIENNDSDTQVISAPVKMSTGTEINPISGDLTFHGTVTNGGNWINVYGDNLKTLNLNSLVSGSGGVAVKQKSVVIITNNNTLTGAIVIEKGVVRLAGSTNAMGASGVVTVGTNATLELNENVVWRPGVQINLFGNGTNGVGGLRKLTSSGSMTWPGGVAISNDAAIAVDGGTLTITGAVSSASVWSKLGAGTLALTANNTYSGKSYVSNGLVQITATNGLGTAAGDSTVISGAALEIRGVSSYEPLVLNGHGISGAGALINDLTSAGGAATNTVALNADSALGGAGALTLSGVISGANQLTKVGTGTNIISAQNTYSGLTIISNGAYRITTTGALGAVSAGTFVRSGATLQFGGGAITYAPELLTVAGAGITNGGALRSMGTGTATLQGQITNSADVTYGTQSRALSFTACTNNLGGFTLTLVGDDLFSMTTGSSFSNATKTTGNGAIVMNGTSYFVLRPSSDMSGNITINSGSFRLTANASGSGLPTGGTLTMAGGTHLSSDGGTARTIHKSMVINGGISMAVIQPGGLTLNNTVSLGGADRALTNNNAVTINGQISNGGIVKYGTGTLTLNSNNTYSGQTLVMAGDLVYGGTNTTSQTGVGTSGYLYGLGSLGNLTITGQVSAGTASNTVGSLRATNLFLASSGRLQVNFANAGNMNGTAGTDWDILTVNGGSGTYTVNSSSGGNEFIIALKGTPTFNTSLGYTNIIVDAGTASSFVANKFTVDYTEFNGGAVGGGTFSVDADSGNLRLIFAPALVSAPDILVQGLAITIPDADTTPSYTDDTDSGDALVVGGLVTKTYTITNSGSAALGIGNIYTNAGGNLSEFIVSAQPGSFNLAVGATTTFQVQFNPTNFGLRFADLEFTNNVSGTKNPYTFRVQGTGTYVEVGVSGLGNNIADGDASPSGTDGTDFGSIALTGGTQLRTFVITNSGNRTLTISGGITTSGTHAADFQITTPPSATIAPSGSTSFVVTFDPNAVGTRSATINFSNNDDSFGDSLTESSFDFAVQGFGVAPSITTFPTSLSFSSVLGTAPATQVFSITNNGLGSMTWSLTTNVTWLSVSNVTGSAAAGAGQVHTAYVGVLAGQVAGTSNATITVTSAEATNSTKTITVQWTISAIPDPSAQSATASGAEHVALRWTKNASYNVMIVHRSGAASTAPSQGTTYNVGGSLGSGTVIYKGAGSYLDHVVSAGTTNYYAFYSYNGDFYSTGVTASDDTAVYQVGEIVEPFAYTNGAGVSGLNGGQGWTSTWTYVGGTLNVVTDRFTSISGYPSLAGNAITSASPEIYRGFAPVTAGKLYVAFMMRTDDGGNTKYNGLSLLRRHRGEILWRRLLAG